MKRVLFSISIKYFFLIFIFKFIYQKVVIEYIHKTYLTCL